MAPCDLTTSRASCSTSTGRSSTAPARKSTCSPVRARCWRGSGPRGARSRSSRTEATRSPEAFAAGLRAAGLRHRRRGDADAAPQRAVVPARAPPGRRRAALRDRAGARVPRRGRRTDRSTARRRAARTAVFVAHAERVDFAQLERAARADPRRRTASHRAATRLRTPARTARSSVAARWSPPRSRRLRARGRSSSASRRAPRCGRSRSSSACRRSELVVIGDDVTMDIALGRLGGCAHGPRAQRDQRPHRRPTRSRERRRPDAVVDGRGRAARVALIDEERGARHAPLLELTR